MYPCENVPRAATLSAVYGLNRGKHLFTQPSASVYVWILQLRRQRVLVKRKYNINPLPRIIMPLENAHRVSFDARAELDSTSTNLLRLFTRNKYKISNICIY